MNKADLVAIYESKPWEVRQKLKEYIASLDDEEEKKPGTRSLSQNKALHLLFEWAAQACTEQGLTFAQLATDVDIPMTPAGIKEWWKALQKQITGKSKTRELKKDEIDVVFDAFCKKLGEKGVEISFPSKESRSLFFEGMDMRERLEYPTHGG